MRFNSLDVWLNWQSSLNPAEIDLGLERIADVLQRMDLSQQSYRWRSEFLLEHGAIDMIVDRRDLRDKIASLCLMLSNRPAVQTG